LQSREREPREKQRNGYGDRSRERPFLSDPAESQEREAERLRDKVAPFSLGATLWDLAQKKKKKKKKKKREINAQGRGRRRRVKQRETEKRRRKKCNTPSPLRLGLSPFFFYNKIFAKIHKVYQST
jgi:hypothetical protein